MSQHHEKRVAELSDALLSARLDAETMRSKLSDQAFDHAVELESVRSAAASESQGQRLAQQPPASSTESAADGTWSPAPTPKVQPRGLDLSVEQEDSAMARLQARIDELESELRLEREAREHDASEWAATVQLYTSKSKYDEQVQRRAAAEAKAAELSQQILSLEDRCRRVESRPVEAPSAPAQNLHKTCNVCTL